MFAGRNINIVNSTAFIIILTFTLKDVLPNAECSKIMIISFKSI